MCLQNCKHIERGNEPLCPCVAQTPGHSGALATLDPGHRLTVAPGAPRGWLTWTPGLRPVLSIIGNQGNRNGWFKRRLPAQLAPKRPLSVLGNLMVPSGLTQGVGHVHQITLGKMLYILKPDFPVAEQQDWPWIQQMHISELKLPGEDLVRY